MPNKGLRKMQAKPLLNITKQFKTKSWAQFQISNTVIAIIKGDDAEVILKYKRAVAGTYCSNCCKVCRTLSLEGIEDLAEDNLNKARVNNGTLIVNDDQYIQNYLTLNSSSIKRLRSFRPQTRYRVLEKELENAKK
jgi:hypothetical protein